MVKEKNSSISRQYYYIFFLKKKTRECKIFIIICSIKRLSMDIYNEVAVYEWLADWYLKNADKHGWDHTKNVCNPDVCGHGVRIPVQIWRHRRTGEEQLAWKMVRPDWPKTEYSVVKKYSCFYVCKRGHTHLCSCQHCNSEERGLVVENQNGNKVCRISGCVVQITREYDWREKKKGAFAPRKARLPDPGGPHSEFAVRAAEQQSRASSSSSSQPHFHNTIDLKMMQSAHRCVVDCLFSHLRQELFYNTRRAKYKQILNKTHQYVKRQRREGKTAYVAQMTTIAINMGWFSNCTYETVVKAQDPSAVVRNICPLIVAFYKCCNALDTHQITFKSFLTFCISFLYCTVRGVRLFNDVEVIPKFSQISFLLPHPSACEAFMKCLWAFYEDTVSPTQQNFLTKTMNHIREVLNFRLDTREKAVAFVKRCEAMTVALREQYSGIIDAAMNS